jgi:hypothetical protein
MFKTCCDCVLGGRKAPRSEYALLWHDFQGSLEFLIRLIGTTKIGVPSGFLACRPK